MNEIVEKIKHSLIDAIEECAWVVEGGDAHDLIDAVEKAHASMAESLTLIRQLERERDTAVEILRDFNMCAGCNHNGCANCRRFDDVTRRNRDLQDNWEWCGIQ